MLGGAALDRVRDDFLGPHRGGFTRLGLEPLDHVGGAAPRVRFELLQQQVAGLVRAQPGDALQLALPFDDQLLGSGDRGSGGNLAVARGLLAKAQLPVEPLGLGQAIGQSAGLVRERLLEGEDFLLAGSRLGFSRRRQLMGQLTRFERGFLAERLRFALGLSGDLFGLGPGAVDGVVEGATVGDSPVSDRAARDGEKCGIGEVDRRHSHGCPRRNMAGEGPASIPLACHGEGDVGAPSRARRRWQADAG